MGSFGLDRLHSAVRAEPLGSWSWIAGALFQGDYGIDLLSGEGLSQTRRPPHFNGVNLGSQTQAEMHAKITGRVVGRSAANFLQEFTSESRQRYPSTDAVAV